MNELEIKHTNKIRPSDDKLNIVVHCLMDNE